MVNFDVANLKILIVEDNKQFRFLLRTILEALDIKNLREASNGEEALEVLKNFKADIAIVDWRMDDVDGIECIRRIRSGEGGCDSYLPIVMMTAYSGMGLAKGARDAGVNEFLRKPVEARQLIRALVDVIDSPRPFIKTGDYFGPDRRRKNQPFEHDECRQEQKFLIPPDEYKL